LGTDPSVADTDGDGVADAQDSYPINAMMNAPPQANPLDVAPPTVTLVKPSDAQQIF
jgi:hypothetical protein